MPFTIDDVQVFDTSTGPWVGGVRMRTRMSIDGGRLDVESLPATCEWELSFNWKNDDRSTVTCTAEVLDSFGTVLSRSNLVVTREPGSGDETIPLTPFRVTVTGTYTVRLYAGGGPVWTKSLLVSGKS